MKKIFTIIYLFSFFVVFANNQFDYHIAYRCPIQIAATSFNEFAGIEAGRYRSSSHPNEIIECYNDHGYRWNAITITWFKSDSSTKRFNKEETYYYSNNFVSPPFKAKSLKLDKKNPNIFRLNNKSSQFFLLRINARSFKTKDGSIWNFSTYFDEKESM